MTFPNTESRALTNRTAAETTTPVSLPLIVSVGATLTVTGRVAVAGAVTFPAGWTKIIDSTADASDDVTVHAWKLADGTEDGTTIDVTHGNGKSAWISESHNLAEDPTVQAPETSGVAIGTSTLPDPNSMTPTGGPKDFMWIWNGGWEGEQTSPPAGSPANYFDSAGANTGTGGAIPTNCRVAVSHRVLNASTENPPSWTISVSDDWTAWPIAIHPRLGPEEIAPTYGRELNPLLDDFAPHWPWEGHDDISALFAEPPPPPVPDEILALYPLPESNLAQWTDEDWKPSPTVVGEVDVPALYAEPPPPPVPDELLALYLVPGSNLEHLTDEDWQPSPTVVGEVDVPAIYAEPPIVPDEILALYPLPESNLAQWSDEDWQPQPVFGEVDVPVLYAEPPVEETDPALIALYGIETIPDEHWVEVFTEIGEVDVPALYAEPPPPELDPVVVSMYGSEPFPEEVIVFEYQPDLRLFIPEEIIPVPSDRPRISAGFEGFTRRKGWHRKRHEEGPGE